MHSVLNHILKIAEKALTRTRNLQFQKEKIGIRFQMVGNYIFVVEKFGHCKRWITGQ